MKIIVLGGTGYLGSKVINRLVEDGQEILLVKREGSSLERLADLTEKIEICNIEKMNEKIRREDGYDCLLNMSCKYPRNAKNEFEIWEANLYNPLKVFLQGINSGIKKCITIGTGLPNSFNVYSISKKELADIMKWYTDQKPVKVCNIELENFYGEDEPTNRFIPNIVDKMKKNEDILLTEGLQIRDFIYIEDVVNSIIQLIYNEDLPRYVDLPLGSGEGVSIRELVEYLKDILNSNSRLFFGAIPMRKNEPDSVADIGMMRKFGIDVRYNWCDGLKKFI